MLSASVIVVSHGRPDALFRCLTGLTQIDYPHCDVIVVANAASAPAVARTGLDDVVTLVPFEAENISAARNAGIARATGDVVAFIDDDAVPEPRWLSHLMAPFDNETVAAAGGYVRGRNGISFQWRGRMVFADAQTAPLPFDGDAPHLVQSAPGRGVKTEGTNMAVRRSVLTRLGGFDEAFAFYLDETDLNMRLAKTSAITALVPLAQVHHGTAESVRRTNDRVPRSLYQVGASLAVFLRKHGPTASPVPTYHREEQRRRLLGHMVDGHLMPGQVHQIMSSFDAGWADGLDRPTDQVTTFADPPRPASFPTSVRPHHVLRGRFWQASALRAKAAQLVRDGSIVTLFLFSFTTLYHRVRFTDAGVWEQSGGQFGRSDRSGPLFRPITGQARALREARRVADVRVPVARHETS